MPLFWSAFSGLIFTSIKMGIIVYASRRALCVSGACREADVNATKTSNMCSGNVR